ncbi:MAG: DMT family transporter [Planctomycetota bacterium]
MPYLSFAAVCLLFGSNFYLMSLSLQAFGPVAVGAGRVLGAAAVMLLLWRLLSPTERVPRDKLAGCLGFGLLANGYPYVMQPYLIEQAKQIGGGAGHSFFGMMVAFTPLLTIMVSPVMLGVWPTRRQLVGVVGGLGFMALLLEDGSQRGITPAMLAMAFSVPLSYAVANTYLRRSLSDVASVPLSATMLLAPAAVLLPLAVSTPLLEPISLAGPAVRQNLPVALAAVSLLGVLGTGITMWLFVRMVQQQGPLFAGMVTYVVPLVALSWGVFDGEQITTKQQIAIAGVLSMVALVQFGSASKQAATQNAGTEGARRAEPPSPREADAAAGELGELSASVANR